jgi:hypothetical protein
MRQALALLAGSERIGPDYLGYAIPAATLILALCAVIALYRRFMNR